MTKPRGKKGKPSARTSSVTMNWCCPHSAVMEKPIMVRQIKITQNDRGLHLRLLQNKPKA